MAKRALRYLVVGGFNTAIGYGIGVGSYLLLASHLPILLIGVIGNVIAISISFVTYKIFVFKTQGQWLTEYAKAFVVYGAMALLGIALLWLLVGQLQLSIWIAQGIIIGATVVISYLSHARFTFHR
jgi:putative flippase GtrA